jgi:hypothetical protein
MRPRLAIALLAVLSLTGTVAGATSALGQDPGLRATTYQTAAGHWVSRGCEPSGTGAIKRDFILYDRVWTLAAPIYADPECKTKVFTVNVGGTYRLRGASSKAAGARLGRFAIGFRQVVPASRAIAAAMTAAKCGNVASRVGYATDILATGCAPLGQQSVRACPVEYDLLKRAGNRLYLGERPADQRGLCSPDRQATTLTPVLIQD